MEGADFVGNSFGTPLKPRPSRGNPHGRSECILRYQHSPKGAQMMDKAMEQLVAQGPLAAAMAVAIWWLASKIKDCEIDRQKLWDKVSELASRHDNA